MNLFLFLSLMHITVIALVLKEKMVVLSVGMSEFKNILVPLQGI